MREPSQVGEAKPQPKVGLKELHKVCLVSSLSGLGFVITSRRVFLMSDHSGLRYLFDQPILNARQARWLATLNKFYFWIRYIKGEENRVVDALNKRVQLNHILVVSTYGRDL